MKKPRAVLFLSVVLLSLLACPLAWADSLTFSFGTLPASGNVAGPPGSTVGWGYTLTNNSATYWLVPTTLSAGLFLNGTPLSLFDFPVVAPLATIAAPFNSSTGAGLYQLTWDLTAPAGFSNTGFFDVSAEFWTNDPLAGGAFFQDAGAQSVPYAAAVTPVPEPSTWLLLGTGLAGLARRRRRTPTEASYLGPQRPEAISRCV